MRKGADISSQTVIFAVSAVLAAGILGGALNILENNVVEERIMEYRAEELATSVGVITHYGSERFVRVEKSFAQNYTLEFENTAGGEENLTTSKANGDPNTVEVEVPTAMDLPSKTLSGRDICLNKTRTTFATPEEVNVRAGSC